jgi:hypothetical protein
MKRDIAAALFVAVLVRAQNPAQPATPLCTASQLTAMVVSSGGAAGSNYINITIRNMSSVACLLRDAPKIEQFDASGAKMKPEVGWPEDLYMWGPRSRSLVLNPAERARVVIVTASRGVVVDETRCGSKLVLYLPRSQKSILTIHTDSCQDIGVTGYIGVR